MQELGPPAAIPEGGQAGRGGRAGAEIGEKARSQAPDVSRGTPDAVHSGPPSPRRAALAPAVHPRMESPPLPGGRCARRCHRRGGARAGGRGARPSGWGRASGRAGPGRRAARPPGRPEGGARTHLHLLAAQLERISFLSYLELDLAGVEVVHVEVAAPVAVEGVELLHDDVDVVVGDLVHPSACTSATRACPPVVLSGIGSWMLAIVDSFLASTSRLWGEMYEALARTVGSVHHLGPPPHRGDERPAAGHHVLRHLRGRRAEAVGCLGRLCPRDERPPTVGHGGGVLSRRGSFFEPRGL